jgi:hypothetical protein
MTASNAAHQIGIGTRASHLHLFSLSGLLDVSLLRYRGCSVPDEAQLFQTRVCRGRKSCLRARLDINGMDGFVRWQGSVRFAQLWGVWNGRQAPFLK